MKDGSLCGRVRKEIRICTHDLSVVAYRICSWKLNFGEEI